ncbi:MAG: HupE/UreJ family protein, partial [Pseudomonadota bacterium]
MRRSVDTAGQFWSALIGFNVGVEFGQLAVIAIA